MGENGRTGGLPVPPWCGIMAASSRGGEGEMEELAKDECCEQGCLEEKGEVELARYCKLTYSQVAMEAENALDLAEARIVLEWNKLDRIERDVKFSKANLEKRIRGFGITARALVE